MSFELHTQLSQDALFIADLTLSQLLLMNDERFPWLILVPKRIGISELYELNIKDQSQLLIEINAVSKMLNARYRPEKLNIAALGNIVPQLHLHIIARFKSDNAWPQPTFGFQKPIPYSKERAQSVIQEILYSLPKFLDPLCEK